MQTLTLARSRLVGTLILLPLVLLCEGCMKKTTVFSSPSHRATVEIWHSSFDNSWRATADLLTGNGRTTIIESHRDAFLYFVHVYWSTDETKIGIIGRGFARWDVASDATTGKAVPFEAIRGELVHSIAMSYNLPPDVDPMQWTDSSE